MEKLNCKSLMIGDWVNLSKGNWSENRQVELIDIEMIAESVYLAEPIPITAEILEKNGFTSYGEAWYLPENKATGNEKILIGFYMYETHISVRNGSKCFDNSVPCKYRACAANRDVFVHQLQHALRLCGIEKEITI